MDAHGGWIATARDLVRLLVAVDGFTTKPDILSQSSINSMVSPSPHNNGYSKGWSVNQFNNWWHTGALDGTASIWVRSSGGFTWALILNKRIINANANNFWAGLDNLPWNCVSQTNNFPTHDLFDFPSENAFSLSISDISTSSMKLSWNGGNGEKKILVAREGGPVVNFPLDGVDYNADASFGQGDDLGDGMFVVYNGTGSEVVVNGLAANKQYHFRLFDYNQNTGTGNHALYQLHQSPQAAAVATITNLDDLQASGIAFYPNPTNDQLQLQFSQSDLCDEIVLTNLQGQEMLRQGISGMNPRLSLADLPAQLYIISFFQKGQRMGSARLVKL
ncbi:MAG: T9SS type A sorting domain-containing protein [Bacteroidota bacterium]